jgi:hypothetical protein
MYIPFDKLPSEEVMIADLLAFYCFLQRSRSEQEAAGSDPQHLADTEAVCKAFAHILGMESGS